MWFLPFFKKIMGSFVSKPPTHMYPKKPMPKDALVRGQIVIEVEKCIFCTICARKCPVDAIKVDRAGKVFEISRFQCVVCNECVDVCPKKCLHMSSELTAASDTIVWDKYVGVVEEKEPAAKDA
jgi:formate hydrogenlyase subunit 6/NADH:ubiquinone oxidoreductase subunit I